MKLSTLGSRAIQGKKKKKLGIQTIHEHVHEELKGNQITSKWVHNIIKLENEIRTICIKADGMGKLDAVTPLLIN